MCRFCLEESPSDQLVAPCKCEGSHKYVHLACLRRWQDTVGREMPKAHTCDVCRGRYTIPLPPLPRWKQHRRQCRRLFSDIAVCVLLFSILGFNPVSILAASTFVWLQHSGVALVGTADGFRLIRYGDPVEGVLPGKLLVAHPTMPANSPFAQTVLLLLEHHPERGSRAICLNKQSAADVRLGFYWVSTHLSSGLCQYARAGWAL